MSFRSRPSGGMGKWLLVSLLLVAGVAAGLLWQHVDFLAGRALKLASGGAAPSWKGAWVDWDGDVTAKDVVLPGRDGGDAAVRFERLRLDTPGWAWLLRSMVERHAGTFAPARLHLVLEGPGGGRLPGPLRAIGTASASPFEAEGCLAGHAWTREDLLAMGLDPLPATLDLDYRIEGGRMHASAVLAAPNVSTVRLERRAQASTGNVLLAAGQPARIEAERWTVQDHGFVAARNAHCAKQDAAGVAAFADRHAASVARRLETVGLAAGADALAAYRDFAANGGEIVFAVEHATPLAGAGLLGAAVDGGAGDVASVDGMALAATGGAIERGGRRIGVQWQRVAPRPLAAGASSTYAALLAERTAAGGAPASGPSIGGVAVSSADNVVSHANLISPGSTVAWDDLGGLQGRWLQLWTAHNAPRHVLVLGMDRGQLRVRTRLGGGHAEYRITRDAFLRARLVQ